MVRLRVGHRTEQVAEAEPYWTAAMELSFSDLKPDRPDELEQIEAAGGLVIFWKGARVRTGHGSEQRHHHLALTSSVEYNAMATTRREGKKDLGG